MTTAESSEIKSTEDRGSVPGTVGNLACNPWWGIVNANDKG